MQMSEVAGVLTQVQAFFCGEDKPWAGRVGGGPDVSGNRHSSRISRKFLCSFEEMEKSKNKYQRIRSHQEEESLHRRRFYPLLRLL